MKKTAGKCLLKDQQGMALISALLLLLVVSLMAVGVSMDTSMDVRIAAYQRFKARSFGFAESAGMAATDILEDNIYDAGWDNPSPPSAFTYPNLSVEYDDVDPTSTIDILQDGVFYMDENTGESQIMNFNGEIDADIITQRIVSKLAKGGAIQVAAGYAGVGKGMGGGGAHVIYNFIASGVDSDQAETDIGIHFRHVTK